jgi:hypothetical protein
MAATYLHQAGHPHTRTDVRNHRARNATVALLLLTVLAHGPRAAAQSIPATQAIGSVPTASLYPDPDGCASPDARREQEFLATRVIAPRKEEWQNQRGGQAAAKPHVKARLAGWPQRLLVDRATLPQDDAEFLHRLASDTWRGLDALTDRDHAIPVRFCGGSLDASRAKIGDYTSGTNIGLYLMATVAAADLELIPRDQAMAVVRRVLATLRQLEAHQGFFFNYYDTTTLERTSDFVSFVDSAWLTTGLVVVRQAFPELWSESSELIDRQDYGLFYDPKVKLMSHGVTVAGGKATPSEFHYGMLYTEARLGSLIAIGSGAAPEGSWFAMNRTLPPSAEWQTQKPRGREKTVRGHSFYAGTYAWRDLRYVPSWGGSLFEALMPVLALDERVFAPRSLGRNDEVHVEIQRLYAEQLGQPVWGMSPSSIPDSVDYGEFGAAPLGIVGYRSGIVTPHASALALAVAPEAATANLRAIASRYDAYGEFGLYDAVNPESGAVAHSYLSLDQAMSFVALANHLKDGCVQKRFAADPIATAVLPMLRDEDFSD